VSTKKQIPNARFLQSLLSKTSPERGRRAKKLYGSCQPSSLHARTAGGSRLSSRISGTNTRERLHFVLDRQSATRIKTVWGAAVVRLRLRPQSLVSREKVVSFLMRTPQGAGGGVGGKIERLGTPSALRPPGGLDVCLVCSAEENWRLDFDFDLGGGGAWL
jgi:hypothetical protein